MKIQNYSDFIKNILTCGFSMGGSNSEGIFSIINWDWKEESPYQTPVKWHTGDVETDPWEWRIRVLNERDDIAYSKVFFKKSGYITKEWYPYFLCVRRGETTLNEAYNDGNISNFAKRIYDIISENGALPLHIIKHLGNFSKEDKSKFDRAIIELQMKMYITMCGSAQKTNKLGEEYGWSSTVFCRTEEFFGDEVFELASKITKDEAIEKITEQIYKLNPTAEKKKILKFILG